MCDIIEIWTARFRDLEPHLGILERALSESERQRAARLILPRDARRFILGRGLLRHLLGRYLDTDAAKVEITVGPWGKPDAAGPVRFNLSHSGDLLLFAFTTGPTVGIDIERIDPTIDAVALARGVFAPSEIAAIGRLGPSAFFRCWTRKESLIKAVGMGLSLPPSDFAVTAGKNTPRLVEARHPLLASSPWRLRDLGVNGNYAAALAVPGTRMPRLRWREFKLP